jgi:hypothetical protein
MDDLQNGFLSRVALIVFGNWFQHPCIGIRGRFLIIISGYIPKGFHGLTPIGLARLDLFTTIWQKGSFRDVFGAADERRKKGFHIS